MLMGLTTEEIRCLCAALGSSGRGFTSEDFAMVINWRKRILIDYILLQEVMRGAITLNVEAGEVWLTVPTPAEE
jgi:hypothetical protein